MKYSTRHVATYYHISVETVRIWSMEFASYLSPTANPGEGKARQFSAEDMEVLSLVAKLKREGMLFEEIHAALHTGQRGIVPQIAAEQMHAITSSDYDKRLNLEIEHLTLALAQTRADLDQARNELTTLAQIREDKAQLAARNEYLENYSRQLEQRIETFITQTQELSERAGREYSKGFIDALRERGDLPKKE